MKIKEIKAIDDLIKTISFSGGFSLKEKESGYDIKLLSNAEDYKTKFNNSVDAAFFKFCSVLKNIEPENQEEYINYFDYKFEQKLIELHLFSGKYEGFYLFLKNRNGF